MKKRREFIYSPLVASQGKTEAALRIYDLHRKLGQGHLHKVQEVRHFLLRVAEMNTITMGSGGIKSTFVHFEQRRAEPQLAVEPRSRVVRCG